MRKETETFSTQKGTIELTKQGLCIRGSSFSPFAITWEAQKPDLPKTGDGSRLAFWLMLVGVAGAGMDMLRRRVQH